MDITNEQIARAFELGGAVVSGGVLGKIIDTITGGRKRRADSDAVVMNTSIKLVQSLNDTIKSLEKKVEKSDQEREVCMQKHDDMRVELTDVKIALRSFFSHVQEHMRNCKEPIVLPNLPDSIKEDT